MPADQASVSLLRAGVAVADITPPIGTELCGYGYYLRRASTSVLDRLCAKALYFEYGGQSAVLITNDLCGVTAALTAQTRDLIEAALGINRERVMLACTHTHSGPATMGAYSIGEPDPLYCAHLPFMWLDLARQAKASAVPVDMTLARGDAPEEGYDRHALDGPLDREIRLAIFSKEGKPLAILANHSIHAVVFGKNNTLISGDWPGAFQRHIEAALPGCVAMFLQGSCGTINSNVRCVGAGEGAPAVEAIGQRLGETAVALAHRARQVAPASIRLGAKRDHAALPVERVSVETLRSQLAQFDAQLEDDATGGGVRLRWSVTRYLLDLAAHGGLPDHYDAEIQALRIGPLLITGVPGELFMALGQKILDAQRDGMAMVAGYANDWMGYFPTAEAYGDNRYTYPTVDAPVLTGRLPFRPEAGEVLAQKCIALGESV